MLKPFGSNRQLWWGGVLPAGKDVYAAGWEGDDELGPCGKGARVVRLSSAGELIWSWQDSQERLQWPTDMIALDGGLLLALIRSAPPADLVGEDMSYCYEGMPAYLVLIGPDGRELDRMVLSRDLDLGRLSRNSDNTVTTLAPQEGLDPDLIVTIRGEGDHITLDTTPIRTALPATKDSAIVTRTFDGYRLLFHSQILALDRDGRLIVKQRRRNVAGSCKMIAGQGDFCWTTHQILFQPLP